MLVGCVRVVTGFRVSGRTLALRGVFLCFGEPFVEGEGEEGEREEREGRKEGEEEGELKSGIVHLGVKKVK